MYSVMSWLFFIELKKIHYERLWSDQCVSVVLTQSVPGWGWGSQWSAGTQSLEKVSERQPCKHSQHNRENYPGISERPESCTMSQQSPSNIHLRLEVVS